MARQGQLCMACFSQELLQENGVLVCKACGTQQEIVTEEADVNDFGGINSRYRSGMSASARRESNVRAQVAPPSDGEILAAAKRMARTYLACLQSMLKAQLEVLVARFGAPPEVAPLARHLWLSYLPYSGLLDFDPSTLGDGVRVFKQSADPHAASGTLQQHHQHHRPQEGGQWYEEPSRPTHLASETTRHARRVASIPLPAWHMRVTINRAQAAMHELLPPDAPLVFCYTALLLLRTATDPLDLCRWALDGDLPHMDLYARSKAAGLLRAVTAPEGQPVPGEASNFWTLLLTPQGAPVPHAVYQLTTLLAGVLGLALPDVNVELLLMRMARDVGLPQEVALVGRELHAMYLLASPAFSLAAAARQSDPYAAVAVLLFLATKLCYGLDGSTAPRLPHVPPMPCPWPVWADGVARTVSLGSSFPITREQVCGLTGEGLRRYLAYCSRLVFSSLSPIDQAQDLVTTLERLSQPVKQQQQQGSGSVLVPPLPNNRASQRLPPASQQQQGPAHAQSQMHLEAARDMDDDMGDANGVMAEHERHAEQQQVAMQSGQGPSGHQHVYVRAVSHTGEMHVDALAVLTVCCLRCNMRQEVLLDAIEAAEEAMALTEASLVDAAAAALAPAPAAAAAAGSRRSRSRRAAPAAARGGDASGDEGPASAAAPAAVPVHPEAAMVEAPAQQQQVVVGGGAYC